MMTRKKRALLGVKLDLTNVMPSIIAEGLAVVGYMKHSGKYSRTKLRKLGLIHDPWGKGRDMRYKL